MIKLVQGTYLGTNRRRLDLGGIQLIDTCYEQPVFNGWHCHEQAHLTFVLSGGNLEKRSRGEEQLTCGKVVFYHRHEQHRNDHTVFPSRNINLELSDALFSKLGIGEADVLQAVCQSTLTATTLIRMARQIEEPCYQNINAEMLLGDAIVNARRFDQPPLWVVSLKELLHDHWNAQPSLQELASEIGVYPTTISRYFIRYFGCTLGTYLRRLKVDRAVTLIRQGRYSLTEIAHRCGFADQSHFIRSFKSETGFLPKSFTRY